MARSFKEKSVKADGARLDKILGLLIEDDLEVECKVSNWLEIREQKVCKHGETYGQIWFGWWGFCLVFRALAAKMPGKFLLDALKAKVGKG